MPTQVIRIKTNVLYWYFQNNDMENEPDALSFLNELKDQIEESLNVLPSIEVIWIDDDGNSVDVDLLIEEMAGDD